MKFAVNITDCGPLSFRSGRETTEPTTLDFVPGSVLMGSLVMAHAQVRGNSDELNGIFFDTESHFGNLYPSVFEKSELHGSLTPVYPVPSTAVTCKRFSGFKFDQIDTEQPHHGVRDSLISWTLFCLDGQSRSDLLKDLNTCSHEGCNQPLDRFTGFYRRNRFNEKMLGKARVRTGMRTRTGIDRVTGSIHQSILYSRETLLPGMTFAGRVVVPDEQADTFTTFVQEANISGLLRMGNNRTRGFGAVTLNVEQIQDDELESLRQQIVSFDMGLRQKAQQNNVSTPHALYLPITLTSDVILYDHLLRHRTVLNEKALATIGIKKASLIYHNSSTRLVLGWNNLWRVPKADDLAIAMGSVFVFGLHEQLDDDLLQKLLHIQRTGIGVRKREGFGCVMVASPFHIEVNEL